MFCCYRCANFAGGVLPNRAAMAADWVANLAMSSRRRNFCFLNLLNLALSPFCDDIYPSSNFFVTQRAEDIACGSDCSACSLAADKMSCGMPGNDYLSNTRREVLLKI